MTIVEQIKSNNITKLRLTWNDDDAIDNIHDLIDAIEKNTSLLTVELLDEFLGCLRNDARSELLRALTFIPCLQEVRLQDGLVAISDITDLLCKVKGLKVLTLKNIILQGIASDFDATEMALHQHCSIKEFSLQDCRPAVSGISMDTLVLPGKTPATGGTIRVGESSIQANARSA